MKAQARQRWTDVRTAGYRESTQLGGKCTITSRPDGVPCSPDFHLRCSKVFRLLLLGVFDEAIEVDHKLEHWADVTPVPRRVLERALVHERGACTGRHRDLAA